MSTIGQSVRRTEAPNKVTGRAKYNADTHVPGTLWAHLAVSSEAHAKILGIDRDNAMTMAGVKAIVTGDDVSLLCGEVLEDRPPLAKSKVRYYGEPIALVVATGEAEAMLAALAIQVDYQKLPVVHTPLEAMSSDAPLIHEDLGHYVIAQPPISPQPGTNIADVVKLRKGDMNVGWKSSAVSIEGNFTLPSIDHAAMETRSAKVEILHDGRVIVHTTTQAPFEVQKLLSQYFGIKQGKVIVNAPLVGGAFGGKATVQLEILAYLASKAVGGRLVQLVNSREQDFKTSPVGTGLQAKIKLGATRQGKLTAAELTFWVDVGAYTDSSPRMARAITSDCTGPYRVDHVHCDTYCLYTNHTYATAYRGFGHMPMTFCIERAMDKLANALSIDPLQLRRLNAIQPGQTTPTGVTLNLSRLGNLDACIDRMNDLVTKPPGQVTRVAPHRVRATGVSCFWKTSSSPPDASSGAIITFNQEGSMNLSTGTVEFGAGTKTTSAQILAERMDMSIEDIHVHTHINTKVDPEHWKTVASLSTFMVGRAVLDAADDAISQLKSLAAVVLRCAPTDLAVGQGRVFIKDDPTMNVAFKDIVHGYQYPEGNAIGGQVIGRGTYIVRHLSPLNPDDGQGRPGPAWTVGCQAVEVELDTSDGTYEILRAMTVVDIGRLINPKGALGMVMGGMCQGLGYGSREAVRYDALGRLVTDQFRTYRTMRMGEQPNYQVDFIETPQIDAPYGARAVGEHGVLAIPSALANALARAAGVEIDSLPATPEAIWRLGTEVQA